MIRVLIVKISSLGDVLHTLPSLTDARQAIPGIRFDWVVEENFAQLPSWHEGVDRVIPVAIRRWRKAWFSAPIKAERKNFYDIVQAVYYDAIIDAQGLIKSAALVTKLANGRIKCGMDWKTAREPLATLFYSRRYHISKNQHAVERTRELFSNVLGYRKPETQGDYAISQHFLDFFPKNDNPYLIFLHGTTRNNKHWPEENWRELINLLGGRRLKIKLPWGTLDEKNRAKRLAAGFDYANVLPYMKLDEIAKQLLGASVVVSVDTGLSHLAAALNCPNIALYGPTDPKLIGVYGKNQYICHLKHSPHLNDLNATKVFSELKSLLIKKKN